MLRAFIKACKSIKKNCDPALSSIDIDLKKARCPACKAPASLQRHATYSRHYVFIEGGALQDRPIDIVRLRCMSCKKTHAVLPFSAVPYSPFSVAFIACLLIDYDNGRFASIEGLCGHYGIAINTFYNLSKRFLASVRLAVGITCTDRSRLRIARMLISADMARIDGFLSGFFDMAGRSFCQPQGP